jgi:hypothetical protein
VEATLGPLPDEAKEMALIAQWVLWDIALAGGGWPEIEELWSEPFDDYESFFDLNSEPVYNMETRTADDGSPYEFNTGVRDRKEEIIGDVYVTLRATECDDRMHVLCPTVTWKNLQQAMGRGQRRGTTQSCLMLTRTAGETRLRLLESGL